MIVRYWSRRIGSYFDAFGKLKERGVYYGSQSDWDETLSSTINKTIFDIANIKTEVLIPDCGSVEAKINEYIAAMNTWLMTNKVALFTNQKTYDLLNSLKQNRYNIPSYVSCSGIDFIEILVNDEHLGEIILFDNWSYCSDGRTVDISRYIF